MADPPRDPGGPISAPGPPRGGGPLRGGKAAALTKLDVKARAIAVRVPSLASATELSLRIKPVYIKARETQVAVVPSRPSPPPPCQSLTRASSWTACAWQGRHMRAWARARAWSGKARASWARSYRTVGSRSSMRATGGAFSANLPPPPLRVRCPRARHTGWRPHLEQAAKTTALRRSSGQSARCPSPS